MPYLQYDESNSKQKFLTRVAERPYIPAAAASLLGMLPKFITVPVLKTFDKGLEGDSADHIAGELFSYTFGHNAFSLAKSEFRTLRQDIDWQWMKDNHQDLGFVFCPDDHWSPRKLYQNVCDHIPMVFNRFVEDQVHGFVTRLGHSHRMARITKEFLSHVNII